MPLDTADVVRTLNEGRIDDALAQLLEAYQHSRDPWLALMIDRLGASAVSHQVESVAVQQTQLERCRALGEAVARALPSARTSALHQVRRMLADASSTNVLELLTALSTVPPDPRIAALALRSLSEVGAVRELSPRIAKALAELLQAHGHAGLLPAYLETEAASAHSRPHVYRFVFNDETRAALATRKYPAHTEAHGELERLITARLRPPASTAAVEALLEAIYADPDNDSARAVYADALLERGDLRGEFIQLQLLRAAGVARKGSAAKEKALLTAHRVDWLGDLHAHVARATARFERGFVSRAELLGRPEQARPLRLLTHLELSTDLLSSVGAELVSVRELTVHAKSGLEPVCEALQRAATRSLSSLQVVSVIERTDTLVAALGAVPALQHLRTLRLARGAVGMPSANTLGALPAALARLELVDSKRSLVRHEAGWVEDS